MSATPLRSAVVIRWPGPVPLDVTLAIDPERVSKDTTVGIVGLQLVRMGGRFVAWKPSLDQQSAVARFEFPSLAARDQFIAEALKISGVSITAPQ